MLTPEPLKVPLEAICRGCGYLLRELTIPRCPECGRLFDPGDPLTWTTSWRLGSRLWWKRRLASWARAPSPWEISATLLTTGLALIIAMRLPWQDNDYATQMLLPAVKIYSGVVILRLVILAVRWSVAASIPRERYRKHRFLCMPICGMVLLLAFVWCDSSLAMQSRCYFHRKRLLALCHDTLHQNKPLLRRIGRLGMIIATPQPGGAVQLTIDLDYDDRWSTCPRRVLYDPSAVSPPPEHDPLWPTQTLFLERSGT